MLNRIRTYLIIFSVALSGCKPRVYTFKYENAVTKEFFKPVSLDKGGKYYEMDSVEVYSALLREQFVNRGSVAEFKIVNVLLRKRRWRHLPITSVTSCVFSVFTQKKLTRVTTHVCLWQ